MNQLVDQLIRHEGMELKPYKCTSDKLTIGIGRNLEDVGISEEEAKTLLMNDLARVDAQLEQMMPWSQELDAVRYEGLMNFVFNVGIGTASKFVNAMGQLKDGNYDMAATELLDSRWAKQVGQRAVEVAEQIRTGEYQ
jgi:lysozyme